MASNDMSSLTADQLENDPKFKSFLSFTEGEAQSDNYGREKKDNVRGRAGGRLAENMDRSNITSVLKKDYERWYTTLEQGKFLTIRKDIELAVANENPESMKIQDIFKNMAAKANQKWDTDVDQLVSQDVERAQSLYLTAPGIKNKVDKLKVDAKLIEMWERDVKNLASQMY